jgi:predicted PurR-regulated permease PerM
VRGQLVLAAVMGVTAGIGCATLGLPFPILIGLFVAVTSLVPLVGAYVGAVPAVLLALLDPIAPVAKLFWVVLLFIVVNETGSKILYPRLIGSATGFPAVLVLFVLLAGGEVGGVLGALLAVPVTALVSVVAVHIYRIWQQSAYTGNAGCASPAEPLPEGRTDMPVVAANEGGTSTKDGENARC